MFNTYINTKDNDSVQTIELNTDSYEGKAKSENMSLGCLEPSEVHTEKIMTNNTLHRNKYKLTEKGILVKRYSNTNSIPRPKSLSKALDLRPLQKMDEEKSSDEEEEESQGFLGTTISSVFGTMRGGTGMWVRKKKKSKKGNENPLFTLGFSAPFYYYLRRIEESKEPVVLFSAVNVQIKRAQGIEDVKSGVGFKTINIYVEYGDLKYTVHKKVTDFVKLYSAMRLLWFVGKAPSLPHFPIQEMYDVELKWLRGMQDKESSILDFYTSLDEL
ncbi:hypothetical protein AX774_g7249, partial [Zancudomyces culisetae]